MNKFYSGYVSIVGLPNVGKSTLLNSILKNKISIVSSKAQTTRTRILGILTDENSQIIFMDTPGIHRPRNKLSEYMIKNIDNALKDADIVVYVLDCSKKFALNILSQFMKSDIKKILVLNKIDLVSKENLLKTIQKCSLTYGNEFKEIIPVSATNSDGIDIILNSIKKMLPEGPQYYPHDDITNQTEREVIAELVRESLINNLQDEIPFGIAVRIENFKKRENSELIDLEINIYCEKESHKPIIIGKNGDKLRKIATESRKEIENFLNTKVYMNLWVKANPEWRNKANKLRNLGYT